MLAFLVLLLSSIVPGPINGDFDHDGKIDTARIVREGRDVYFLQINRGAAPDAPARLSLGLNPPDYMVPAKNSGATPTACGKGAGSKSDPCPHRSVQVTRGDLMIGHAEASEAVVLWDGAAFRLEWLTD